MAIKSIVAFCGSKAGKNENFVEDAAALGKILAEQNIELIYGGGNTGIMAAVANGCLQNGGRVVGIIPKTLTVIERQHTGLSELIVTEDMHTRKKLLYEKSDAAIVLPGGYGTLDEIFEMLTWNQLKIHEKKTFFLNTDGFYDNLIAHVHTMHNQGFLYNHPDEQMTVLNKPIELEDYL